MTTIRCTATWSMCIRIRGWRSTLRTFSGIIFIGRLIWQSVCRWSRFSCLSRSSWWLRRGNWWRRRCCSSCQWCNTSWNRSSCCLRWSRIWRWITWTLDCWWQWCQRLIANVFLNLQKQKLINLLSIYQIRKSQILIARHFMCITYDLSDMFESFAVHVALHIFRPIWWVYCYFL